LVAGGVLSVNPPRPCAARNTSSRKARRRFSKKGKTPVLTPDEARLLLNSLHISDNSGLRDRALLAVMVYSFARVSAASSG
jgi:integrase